MRCNFHPYTSVSQLCSSLLRCSYPTFVLSLDYNIADYPDSPNIPCNFFKTALLDTYCTTLLHLKDIPLNSDSYFFCVTGGSCRCAAVSNIFSQGYLKNKSRASAQHFFLPFAVWTGVKRCMMMIQNQHVSSEWQLQVYSGLIS